MANYTVTRTMTRPNTSIEWPAINLGLNGYNNLKSLGKVTISYSYDSDNLVETAVFVWSSKEEYRAHLRGEPTRDSTLAATSAPYFDYMAENNMTGRIEEEDGTIKVFNSTSKSFEVE